MAILNLVIANEGQGHILQRPGCCQSTGNMCDSVKNQLWRSACIVVYLDPNICNVLILPSQANITDLTLFGSIGSTSTSQTRAYIIEISEIKE